MVRKCLLIGLALMLLVALGGTFGCGTGSISGTYVNEDNSEEYLELNGDGTLYLKEYGVGLTGNWKIEGDVITLSFPSMMGIAAKAEIKGNKIYDEDGKVWVKK